MSNKKIYMETLRIMAILFVFFNHTWTGGYLLFTQKQDSILYPFYIGVSLLSKVAVPIFLMISGSLLLSRQDSVKDVFKKRISRILGALLVSSLLYYLVFYFPHYSFLGFLKLLYSREVVPSLWYLYAFLGILLILPFLQRMVQHLEPTHFYYLIVLHFMILGILPILQYLVKPDLFLHRYLQVNLATPLTVFYFIIGYFIDKQEIFIQRKQVNVIGIMAAISLLANILLVMLHVKQFGVGDLVQVERFHNVLFMFPTFYVFLAVKRLHLTRKFSNKTNEVIVLLGSLTFGIYLIERFLWLSTKFIFLGLDRVLPTFIACLIWVLSSFLLGVIVVYVAKKIPFLKRII